MRSSVLAAALLLIALLGGACGGRQSGLQHPLTNELDPAYEELRVRTLAALPFASDIGEREDPDGIAAPMVASMFYGALGRSKGFTVMPASEVERVLEEAGLKKKMNDFYKDWINDQEDIDKDFIVVVAEKMQVDAVVAGAVDVWYQKEIDITESGSARTQVGAMIGVFDGKSGKRLWLGRDENSKDALRYSGAGQMSGQQVEREMERTNRRTAGGVYAPPDYSEVVELIVDALLTAFPESGR